MNHCTTIQWFYTLLRAPCLSPEIHLMILEHCSPADLITMNQIDPFRSFLASSPTIWESARATHGVPAPEFGFTELEHAKRLFEGGKCSVSLRRSHR
ncbi:hypothetical protein R3P38DRAFT_513467 [Favolaschia claudopus]|uniref:Uncharacterized protein n=1 Tax=Favolaschia claudopus TaxID=2862362 RepID=A0AAV9ZCY6_9AGAR